MAYTFTFDAKACSGCKTCQVACKDRNGLPTGVLWRRVIEVTGGEWSTTGSAWESTVFAYNLSLACNHCTFPKCAGVCPTDAFNVRPDGIVLIDGSKCMGCRYCAWACPYGAPQFDARRGIMTKCDFCYRDVEAGLPPTCVAACPLRVLDYGTIEGSPTSKREQHLWQLPASVHPFPLPNTSRTEPHLSIRPHPAMNNPLEKRVSNWEEIQPQVITRAGHRLAAIEELPLVAFTVLAQMSVGLALCSLAFTPPPMPLLLSIGILLGTGGVISFLHLGRKRNAWRSIVHLKKSWLSREILLSALFGAAWAVTVGLAIFNGILLTPWLMIIPGVGLVFSMSQVYRLRAVPGWNTWRTPVSFFLSAAILGVLGANLLHPFQGWSVVAGLTLALALGMLLTSRPGMHDLADRLRAAMLGLALVGTSISARFPPQAWGWQMVIIFILAFTAEAIGRWQFYAARKPFLSPR